QPSQISDNEITQFSRAFRDIQVIDQNVQQDMANKVQEEGIDVERFNNYLAAQQDSSLELDATEEEIEKFGSVYENIETLHQEAEKEMHQKIADNDLTIERFQEIAMLIQSNPELLEKLQEHYDQ